MAAVESNKTNAKLTWYLLVVSNDARINLASLQLFWTAPFSTKMHISVGTLTLAVFFNGHVRNR